jgi:hypothetical protein
MGANGSFNSNRTHVKSPFSGAGKHPDFQVTSCHHFDTTDVDFACIESEYCPIINANIVDQT